MASTRRALHFVFKVGNRTETTMFYRDVLGMKFLRHEEFEKGCDAACNGPYDGRWSKSMVGYGAEDSHFVVELTYNYGIGSYTLGNDFLGLSIDSPSILENAKSKQVPIMELDGKQYIQGPDGHKFYINSQQTDGDPVKMVSLASSDLKKSVEFWRDCCGLTLYTQDNKTAVLGYAPQQCQLELRDIGKPVERCTAFGRIAFSAPREQLPSIEETMKKSSGKILTPLISLDTPGKATVEVVIVADPDGHEICFVGDEAFRELSQVDPQADKLLDEAVAADKSDEWFKKKGKSKAAAE